MKTQVINKKIIAIVTIIALCAILAVCLVACNNQDTQDAYEKHMQDKGYDVVTMTTEQLKTTVGEDVGEVEWAIFASKSDAASGDGQYVGIIKFKNESDAKEVVDSALAGFEEIGVEGFTAVLDGAIVFIGTTNAVNDAK